MSAAQISQAMTKAELDQLCTNILGAKVKGKSPPECVAELGFGKPLLTVRSENTQRLAQLYDAGMVTDLGTPHYCIVRFDGSDRGEDLEFVAVGASTKKEPVAR